MAHILDHPIFEVDKDEGTQKMKEELIKLFKEHTTTPTETEEYVCGGAQQVAVGGGVNVGFVCLRLEISNSLTDKRV